jgi:hypothetical protein
MDDLTPKTAVESLQNLMVAIGRGTDRTHPDFARLRNAVLAMPELKPYLPDFVTTCRNGAQFWAYIKGKANHYQERDQHIWSGFSPVLSYLENRANNPGADEVSAVLQTFDSEHVHSAWQKALARKTTDPEAALTSARTLLESTCKRILDSLAISYSDTADLPDLYSAVAKGLNLSPSQHTEQIFKQVLGGCHSVVQGLGAMRNRLGDAHGKGIASYKPLPRHAALAVNLSGAMAMFLVETFEARRAVSP